MLLLPPRFSLLKVRLLVAVGSEDDCVPPDLVEVGKPSVTLIYVTFIRSGFAIEYSRSFFARSLNCSISFFRSMCLSYCLIDPPLIKPFFKRALKCCPGIPQRCLSGSQRGGLARGGGTAAAAVAWRRSLPGMRRYTHIRTHILSYPSHTICITSYIFSVGVGDPLCMVASPRSPLPHSP